MTALVTPGRITISPQTVREAKESAPQAVSLALRDASGREIMVPRSIQDTLLQALDAIAEHGAVSIAQVPEELSSTVAAQILGVSRPTLMKWVEQGELTPVKVGTHHRFPRVDVLALKARRERERAAAFAELRELDTAHDDLLLED